MLNTPFAPWPSFTQEEADIASRVLLSNKVNYWTGTECREFEKEFAAWAGCKHAIALSNGTVAIELALRVLGIGPGDEVVVTPRTFLATASCVAMAGAKPVFADIDPESQNLTAETIRPHLSPRTRAILCVHLAGWPCEMDGIMALAEQHGLFVIEDCAQAHGATYKGRSVGGIGHIGTWSFCQDKIITTGGEGGMITTNDPKLWDKAWSSKDHGRSWDAVYNRKHPPGHGFRWLYESFGTNGRMTEMQGAIGRHQLRRLPQWHEARSRNAERILSVARRHSALRAPQVPDHSRHAWYKCYLFVRPERLHANWTRDRIMTEINEAGVPCYSGACPEIYLEKAFDGTGYRPAERLAAAKDLGETSLMFLVHPTLSDADMDKTARVLDDVVSRASRESASGNV